MTRAEFIKNLGLFGTLLTVLGYKQALAIKDNDPINVTNTTIFDLEFFSDRYGKKHNCQKLVNQINDYFRSNKRPNKEQILESGIFFSQQFYLVNKQIDQIGRGKSNLSNPAKIDLIEDFLALSILKGKSNLLLGNGNVVSNCFHQAEHLFIRMSSLNLGKNHNLFPKGLVKKYSAFVYKEMAETFLKTDFYHTTALNYINSLTIKLEDFDNKALINYLPVKERKRLKLIQSELLERKRFFIG